MNTNPEEDFHPLVMGTRTAVHIVQPAQFYPDGRPLPAWLNPPILMVPVPMDIYEELPFPSCDNYLEAKIKSDSDMHVVFYPE